LLAGLIEILQDSLSFRRGQEQFFGPLLDDLTTEAYKYRRRRKVQTGRRKITERRFIFEAEQRESS